MESIFETEKKAYENALPKLLREEGKFALIREDNLVGVYETYEDALKFGYEKFGLEPFFIKRIQQFEETNYILSFPR